MTFFDVVFWTSLGFGIFCELRFFFSKHLDLFCCLSASWPISRCSSSGAFTCCIVSSSEMSLKGRDAKTCIHAWCVWRGSPLCNTRPVHSASVTATAASRRGLCVHWGTAVSPPPAMQTRQPTCINARNSCSRRWRLTIQPYISRKSIKCPQKHFNYYTMCVFAVCCVWTNRAIMAK